MRRKPWIWTRIFRLEQDFTEKKVDLAALSKTLGIGEDWGITREIRQLRELIKDMPNEEVKQ